VVEEAVDEGELAAEHDGHEGGGVEVELGEGVQLGEDVEAHEVGLVDEEDGDLFCGADVLEGITHGFEEAGGGEEGCGGTELEADLAEQLEHGAGGGDEAQDAVLGRVEAALGVAEGSGLAGADFAGDYGDEMGVEGIVEALEECVESREGEEFVEGNLLGEGFGTEAEGVGE
jgi:hypothetical protein